MRESFGFAKLATVRERHDEAEMLKLVRASGKNQPYKHTHRKSHELARARAIVPRRVGNH